jgi:CHAD domain-containing protein
MDQCRTAKIRRDGWTAQRQLRFLDTLARTRSVTRAAAAVGMSRESAYRLRSRKCSVLFAIAWDRATKGHKLVVRKTSPAPKIPENPPKVTKWKKWKNPRFHTLLDELRDL